MAQDTSISREAHSSEPLASQVVSGRDRSVSEALRAALRAALVEGEASGEAAPFDMHAFIAVKRA